MRQEIRFIVLRMKGRDVYEKEKEIFQRDVGIFGHSGYDSLFFSVYDFSLFVKNIR